MYKVFINGKTVTVRARNVRGKPCDHTVDFSGTESVRDLMRYCADDDRTGTVCLSCDDPDAAWETLRGAFTLIRAAGGLVFNDRNHLLMIFRHGKWDLPKGKLDEGESAEAAAVREVCEETGVCSLRIVSPPVLTRHCYRLGKRNLLKETSWFEMACDRFDGFTVQTAEGITQAGWFGKEEALKQAEGSYPLVRELVGGLKFKV